jgi:hypothetical protein
MILCSTIKSLKKTKDLNNSFLKEATPQHIKELQLKIWMDKTPAQRLKLFLEDNDALQKFWAQNKTDFAKHDSITKDKAVVSK